MASLGRHGLARHKVSQRHGKAVKLAQRQGKGKALQRQRNTRSSDIWLRTNPFDILLHGRTCAGVLLRPRRVLDFRLEDLPESLVFVPASQHLANLA